MQTYSNAVQEQMEKNAMEFTVDAYPGFIVVTHKRANVKFSVSHHIMVKTMMISVRANGEHGNELLYFKDFDPQTADLDNKMAEKMGTEIVHLILTFKPKALIEKPKSHDEKSRYSGVAPSSKGIGKGGRSRKSAIVDVCSEIMAAQKATPKCAFESEDDGSTDFDE